MDIYTIDKDIFRKSIQKNTSTYVLILLLVGLFTSYFFIRNYQENQNQSELIGLGIFLLVLFGFGTFRILRMRKRLMTASEIFRLKIDPENLTKQSFGVPDRTIPIAEISHIYHDKSGVLIISTDGKEGPIIIPAAIENRLQLEETLQKIKPFDPKPPSGMSFPFHILLAILSLILLALHFFLKKDGYLYGGLASFVLYYLLRRRKK